MSLCSKVAKLRSAVVTVYQVAMRNISYSTAAALSTTKQRSNSNEQDPVTFQGKSTLEKTKQHSSSTSSIPAAISRNHSAYQRRNMVQFSSFICHSPEQEITPVMVDPSSNTHKVIFLNAADHVWSLRCFQYSSL